MHQEAKAPDIGLEKKDLLARAVKLKDHTLIDDQSLTTPHSHLCAERLQKRKLAGPLLDTVSIPKRKPMTIPWDA